LSERRSTLFTNWSWEDYYSNSAKGRVLDAQLEGWRNEILAGKTPVEWQSLLEADRPATGTDSAHLDSLETYLTDLPRLPSQWPGILAPSLLLGFGWLALGVRIRPGASVCLPPAARSKLLTLAAVRILACALFSLTFLVEGFRPSGLLIFALAVLGWRLLWDFVHALAPAIGTRRENVLFHAAFWVSLLIPVTVHILMYLSKGRWIPPVFGIATLLTALLVLVMALAVCALYGLRLWRWKPEGELRRMKPVLLLSTPLIVLHALASLSLPLFQESNPNGAILLLWADAALPWLLIAGLAGLPGRRGQTPIAAPVAAG
jgi:hypothetical protein